MDWQVRNALKIGSAGAVGACVLLLLAVACEPGMQNPGGQAPADQQAGQADVPGASGVLDASDTVTAGSTLFRDTQPIADESQPDASCAQCHGDDGSGTPRAPSVRGADEGVLQGFAQGDVQHLAIAGGRPSRVPEVKFPELTEEDFAALAAFLAEG